MTPGTSNKTRLTEDYKIKEICTLMSQYNYTPKSFMNAYLNNDHITSATQQRFWGTEKGWPSTSRLLGSIRLVVSKNKEGLQYWREFILSEATEIVKYEKPPSGAYPAGAYHNTSKILERPSRIRPADEKDTDSSESDSKLPSDSDSDDLEEVGGQSILVLDHFHCTEVAARTICGMVAFLANQRHNSQALSNSLTFLACGVTKRLNKFLHYIGLSASRSTAQTALSQLSHQANRQIVQKLSNSSIGTMAPFLCVDNLDFEQRVHSKSLGHSTRMFHGTWGYVHHPHPALVASVPSADLTVESFQKAMSDVATLQVIPKMFVPSPANEQHWSLVLKAQLGRAFLEYVGEPMDSKISIATAPPVIDQISADAPDITMLKLSDNSAQGVGEVFDSIISQSRMDAVKFSSCLQVIDGDLSTCTNISTLRTQRIPSAHIEDALSNVLTILGGAHTLWNIAHAIYTKHEGDSSDSRDSGSWRFLKGLGIPSANLVDKKDYTLMIKNIKKIHMATLVHCIMIVLGTEKDSITEELPKLTSKKVSDTIKKTYIQFFSPESKAKAASNSSPKLSNLILRLSDFATIVEGNLAMKCGDIGRVMNIWKRWAIIAQGIKKLTQYSIQLPRMIILLNYALPDGLSQVIKHSLLVAPNAGRKHYLPKDQYLEMKNYWLKHFFNDTGRGTNINPLKDLYSVNVTLLQDLIRSLTAEIHKKPIFQSHHNQTDLRSMNNCLRMCRQNNVCTTNARTNDYKPELVENFFSKGLASIREKALSKKGRLLNKL
ncbi:hypothetical protein PCANC_17426 [Puccinia coronata f. sp. avenae]|uniref:DUF6589 domain-containing protein n=1 Tax=Puccinia coronata f. sp. avenae TaxID=200324 RepID=A0A2N5UUY5_9BASI|nr:hypothetical protein PCANC_17426 [Puccinia coronata f. sp. avenae]